MIPFGDHAVRFPVGGSPRERRALEDALRALPGVIDVVIAEDEGCIVFEGAPPDIEGVRPNVADVSFASHVVPTIYDGEDLTDLSRISGLSTGDVVRAHSEADYEVSFIGFMPGFAYLRGVPERLVVPRRANPRPRVAAGSVAIAARYAGIYPRESPGGWHLVGRASAAPAWSIGDRVRFVPVDRLPETPRRASPRAPLTLGDDAVTVVQGFAHVVGPPVHGRMHEGVPPGGPLVIEAFARLGTATAIEVLGAITVGDRVVGSGPDARLAYVGLREDAPVGTRILRGDRVAVAGVTHPSRSRSRSGSERIAIMPGPHALDLSGTFRVSPTSNRVGVRLEGPPLATTTSATSDVSRPMVKGAIELTPSGLVVLGPDHPTTGGYPVVGVLREHAMDPFYALPAGASVQFTTE